MASITPSLYPKPESLCVFMELIRKQKLEKVPGVAETLDWARSLVTLHQDHLDPVMVESTLGIVWFFFGFYAAYFRNCNLPFR